METSFESVPNTILIAELSRRKKIAHELELQLRNEYIEPHWRKLFFSICAYVALVMFICAALLPKEWTLHPLFLFPFAVSFAATILGSEIRLDLKRSSVRKKMLIEHADDYAILYGQ